MTFFRCTSAAAVQNATRSGMNCASSMAITSVPVHCSSPTAPWRSASRATALQRRATPSCDTISSSEYRLSLHDLTRVTCSPLASSTATRSRSAVVLPANMGPMMMWISPVVAPRGVEGLVPGDATELPLPSVLVSGVVVGVAVEVNIPIAPSAERIGMGLCRSTPRWCCGGALCAFEAAGAL
eukprot:CAMPEP_0198704618 /NCGR_PEP_ID=MMETSP1468-20131203/389996_1 /TAXON_ID=1461545 /ORGANISM="Mantoniella sp, Strain CCMP1436" /LENGTH=182 /DNA_ID=CAMNT_0044463441 /DNA_START=268 /DNA_END=816 /DNA_ORIENTATION=+